jgi:hypothetical protein
MMLLHQGIKICSIQRRHACTPKSGRIAAASVTPAVAALSGAFVGAGALKSVLERLYATAAPSSMLVTVCNQGGLQDHVQSGVYFKIVFPKLDSEKRP